MGVSHADLHYVSEAALDVRRERAGRGFRYRAPAGGYVSDPALLDQFRSLAVPPGWTEVRLSADPAAHLQAVGRDARGRKQYIYHPEWRRQQQENKFGKLVCFGEALPGLRAAVRADMASKGLPRQRVVATVVWLLENTFIRIGSPEYARANGSYGLTTLREKHVEVNGHEVRFEFPGKSGIRHALSVSHPRVARTIRQCIELPGYELFQYVDDDGQRRVVESRDVNDYLREQAGQEFTAKDFRTWGGTVQAGATLEGLGPAESATAAKANLAQAVRAVARRLGNTVAVCRQYYVHPAVAEAYTAGRLGPHYAGVRAGYSPAGDRQLSAEEYAAWTLIGGKK